MSLNPKDPKASVPQDGSPTARFELDSVSTHGERGKEPHQMSQIRSEFLHERGRLTDDHVIIERVGYLGSKRGEFVERMNNIYGVDGWTIGYVLDGKALSRDEALQLYERSYEIFLKNNPSITHRLVHEAREIYDTALSNVESGLDYHKQEDSRSHLQDIAIRRAMKTLGLSFKGDKLMQVREADSDFPELSPGKVPFALPKDRIITPLQYKADWIQRGSVEDFWQNNKYIFAKRTSEAASKYRNEVERLLDVGDKAQHQEIEDGVAALLRLEPNKGITQRYIDYVHQNDLSLIETHGFSISRIQMWTEMTLRTLCQSFLTRSPPFKDILDTVDALSPTYNHLRSPYGMEEILGVVPDSLQTTVHAAMACTFMNYLSHGEWSTRENLPYVLGSPGVYDMLKNNEHCRSYIKATKFMQHSPEEISAKLDEMLPYPNQLPYRENLRAILLDIKKNG
jgi:hypothetical protein